MNAQSAVLETALEAAGIPYVVRGATRFFELPEVREALLLLRGATVTTAATERTSTTVAAVLRSIGWSHQEPTQPGAVRDRWESLDAIMKLAEAAPESTTLRAFVDDLLERQAGQHEPTVAAVTLATLHSAKGLEWDSVHLVGLAEGWCRSDTRAPTRQWRRSGASSTWGSRGHASGWRCPGRRASTPDGVGSGHRAASWLICADPVGADNWSNRGPPPVHEHCGCWVTTLSERSPVSASIRTVQPSSAACGPGPRMRMAVAAASALSMP